MRTAHANAATTAYARVCVTPSGPASSVIGSQARTNRSTLPVPRTSPISRNNRDASFSMAANRFSNAAALPRETVLQAASDQTVNTIIGRVRTTPALGPDGK